MKAGGVTESANCSSMILGWSSRRPVRGIHPTIPGHVGARPLHRQKRREYKRFRSVQQALFPMVSPAAGRTSRSSCRASLHPHMLAGERRRVRHLSEPAFLGHTVAQDRYPGCDRFAEAAVRQHIVRLDDEFHLVRLRDFASLRAGC